MMADYTLQKKKIVTDEENKLLLDLIAGNYERNRKRKAKYG